MKFKDSALAHRFLDGKEGIEIGASAHNPFNIHGCKFVDYTDDMHTIYKEEERRMCGEIQPVDYVAYAWDLPFPDQSFDYVLSSHVLEHCWDVLGTIREWLRVLRPGGLIFMILPHPDRTFDKGRPSTTWSELRIRQTTVKENFETGLDKHFSVWRCNDWLNVDENIPGVALAVVEDPDDKVGNGFTVVLRKISPIDKQLENGDIYLQADGAPAGAIVLDKDKYAEVEDVLVQYFTRSGPSQDLRRIDKFKLTQVRYYLPDTYPFWVPEDIMILSEQLKG